MAKVKGIIEIQGSVGDLCFYKTRGRCFVRSKPSVSRNRVKNDPAYARTREHNAEFARIAGACKVFRQAFHPILRRAGDSAFAARLMRSVMYVIKSDNTNPSGKRTVNDGKLSLLEGFEFNENAPLGYIMRRNIKASIARKKGTMVVDIPAFSPVGLIKVPASASHFRFIAAGAAIDFDKNTYETATSESDTQSVTLEEIGPLQLTINIKPRSTGMLFLLFGIEFLHTTNGQTIPLLGRNALAVVAVKK